MKNALINGVILAAMLFFLADAWADDYHYVNLLVGNRAAGLGGAYTALADDPAGCFYNPAGIAFAPNDSLSASVNAFSSETKTYKNAMLDINGNGKNWKQKSAILLPNFFGMVKQIDRHAIGFSYAVTNSTLRRQEQTFHHILSTLPDNSIERFEINIDDSDRTYLFGPSYAYKFAKNLSVGTTLYVYYRDFKVIRTQLLLFEQGEHFLSNYYQSKEEWGIKPSLGVIWEPMEKLSLGLNFSKIYVNSSDRQTQLILRDTTSQTADFSDTDTIFFSAADSDQTDEFPLQTTFGTAYFVSSKLLFSGDISFHEDINDRRRVVNFALGTEYYFNEKFALRAGFWSDFANTAKLSGNKVNQAEHIDLFGTGLSLTYFKRQSSVSFGCNYGFGDGKAQVVADNRATQDVESRSIIFYISAGYRF